ncbi:hypothetical protein [Bradyrhizobium sp. SRL28]|uniref:hypothetical protein n=1 Tax=Bradyrhizobium sp. SRL28 TaxID=2836178 RepID=UPI00201BA187|nr:hypothetical protein [Bradyrhizobium sp. SRL28]
MIAESGTTTIVPLLGPLFAHPHCSEVDDASVRYLRASSVRRPVHLHGGDEAVGHTADRRFIAIKFFNPQGARIVVCAFAFIAGLMIALNFGARLCFF